MLGYMKPLAALGGATALALGAVGMRAAGRSLAPSGGADLLDDWVVDDPTPAGDGSVQVTFLGTTMFLVDDGETQLLIDAFLTHVPLHDVALFRNVATNTTAVDDVLRRIGADRVSDIFIAHSHHDHAFDAGYVARATGATLRGTQSTLNIGRGSGVDDAQMAESRHGERVQCGAFEVEIRTSKHSPGSMGGEGACISLPLGQPCHALEFKEGGCLDFVVRHGDKTLLFKSSANFLPGALDDLDVDVLFLGVATLGRQSEQFRADLAREVIDATRPRIVVPTHWNDFFAPLSERMRLNRRLLDDTPAGLHELRSRTQSIGAEFRILQGYGRLVL